MIQKIILAIALCMVQHCFAATAKLQACYEQAARVSGVSPLVLQSIARVESGERNVVRINKNGTRDYGVMQINSVHLPRLRKLGLRKADLMRPCTNVLLAASMIAAHVRRYRDTWQAIGAYHSKTPSRRDAYALRVRQQWSAHTAC